MFVVSSFVAFVRLEVSFPESAFEGLLSRLNPFSWMPTLVFAPVSPI